MIWGKRGMVHISQTFMIMKNINDNMKDVVAKLKLLKQLEQYHPL